MTTIARTLPVLLLLFAARPAAAAPIDDAKKAFAEGKAAFERGDYEAALAAYQRANTILPAPNLYYNIGATYERLGRYQEAALAFDKYFEMAGAPQTDEEKQFQEKLHARADADRHRVDLAHPPTTQQQHQQQQQVPPPPPAPPPGQPVTTVQQPYYMQPYMYGPPQIPIEQRLREAKARRTRAIVLMAIGVPMTIAGVATLGWAGSADAVDISTRWGAGFVGFTLGVVGITLWAPGAASYVHASRDITLLSRPQPVPPSPRGF